MSWVNSIDLLVTNWDQFSTFLVYFASSTTFHEKRVPITFIFTHFSKMLHSTLKTPERKPLKLWKIFSISPMTLFLFLRYSTFCNFPLFCPLIFKTKRGSWKWNIYDIMKQIYDIMKPVSIYIFQPLFKIYV